MQKEHLQGIEREIGQVVSELRKLQKMTQKQFAEKLSEAGMPIDASAVSRLEKGERALRIAECVIVADVLDVEISYLLGAVRTPAQGFKALRRHIDVSMDKMGDEAWNWLAGLTDAQLYLEQHPDLIEQVAPELKTADDYLPWVASRLSEIEYVHDHFGAEAYIYAKSERERELLLRCVSSYFEARVIVSDEQEIYERMAEKSRGQR